MSDELDNWLDDNPERRAELERAISSDRESQASALIEFLLARIAEDKHVAHAADLLSRGVDRISSHSLPEFAEYMTHWQPNRVLTEASAKRLLVERFRAPDPHEASEDCDDCWTLYALAAAYEGHPDYREEWKL